MRLETAPEPPATADVGPACPRSATEERGPLPCLCLGRSQILVLAVWFGVLTGFCELAAVALCIYCLGNPLGEWPDLLWMSPLADALLLVAAGLFLALGTWLHPGVGALRLVAFTYLTFLSVSLLYHVPGLSSYARILLALGLSTQMVRVIARRPRLLSQLLHWTTAWNGLGEGRRRSRSACSGQGAGVELLERRQVLATSTAAVAGLAAAVYGWRWLRERHALAALPPADSARPNVLLIVLDTVRAQSLSLHGYSRPTTPNLERLARQGVSFRRAIAPASWTLPSHAAMFTGRRLRETKVDYGIALDDRYATLAEVLSGQGYQTAGFVANKFILCPAYGLARGFIHYECLRASPGQVLEASALGNKVATSASFRTLSGYYQFFGRKTAAMLNEEVLGWLDRRDACRPFFAFLNYFDAHQPYIPSAEAAGHFGSRAPKNPWVDCHSWYSPDELLALRDAYDRCILGLDAEVGRLLGRLKERGHLENTVVLVTSDHGEHFGEHDLVHHALSLYAPLLHVPLIIVHPSRVPAGELVTPPISLRHLPATILDLVGLGEQRTLPGESLAPLWESRRAIREVMEVPAFSEVNPPPYPLPRRYPVSKGPMKSLVWRAYHYIRNGDGAEELYHLDDDPNELHNLAGSTAVNAVLGRMRAGLAAL